MPTVLIADDERITREGIQSAVDWNALGIRRVLLAADGREACEIIQRHRPDIAIVDIVMPEMTGIEVISHFHDNEQAPEFVIISGHCEFDFAREAIRCNVNDYLLKPCDCTEIEDTMRRVLARLNRRRSMVEEHARLQHTVESLLPQAQKQIVRALLTDNTPAVRELFHFTFGRPCDKYRLILLTAADLDDPGQMVQLKRSLECSAFIDVWCVGAVLGESVAFLVDGRDGTGAVECVQEAVARLPFEGVRMAVSDPGDIKNLPDMYQEACRAIKLMNATAEQYSKPVRDLLHYVHRHLSDRSLSLSYIATNVLFLHPDYLGKLFKKELGIRFSDYLMTVRMEKAKEIIESGTDLKVYEVAQQVGLGDNPAYFGQVFRKYTGMPPSDYRAKYARQKKTMD